MASDLPHDRFPLPFSILWAYKDEGLYNIDSKSPSLYSLGLLYFYDRSSSSGGMVTTLMELLAPTFMATLPGVAFF